MVHHPREDCGCILSESPNENGGPKHLSTLGLLWSNPFFASFTWFRLSLLVPGDAGAGVVGERPPDALRGLDALQELPLRIRAGNLGLVLRVIA